MKSYCLPIPDLKPLGLNINVYNTPRFTSRPMDCDSLHSIFVYKSSLISSEKISANNVQTIQVIDATKLHQIFNLNRIHTTCLLKETNTNLPIAATPLIHLIHHVTGPRCVYDLYEPEICIRFSSINKAKCDNGQDPSQSAAVKFANLLLNLPKLPIDVLIYQKGSYKCLNHMPIRNQGYFLILPCLDPATFNYNEKHFSMALDFYKSGQLICKQEIPTLSIEQGYIIDLAGFDFDYELFSIQAGCRCVSYFINETRHGLVCEHSLAPHYYHS